MWEPHLSLLMLKGNVEVLSAYQEWSSWAGGAGLVGHRHGGEHGPEKSREGLRAAAGGETAPSKAWGTNHSGDVPIPQLLLEPLAAVTWRASAHFQHLPTLLGSRAREKIAIDVTPWCPLSRAVHRLREDAPACLTRCCLWLVPRIPRLGESLLIPLFGGGIS